MVKTSLDNAGYMGLIPGSGRCPRIGDGSLFQYSCQDIPLTEEPGGVQSRGPQNWTWLSTDAHT